MSHSDVLMISLNSVSSHTKNKKKELKIFLELINATNSLKFSISINKKVIKRINVAKFIELNLINI